MDIRIGDVQLKDVEFPEDLLKKIEDEFSTLPPTRWVTLDPTKTETPYLNLLAERYPCETDGKVWLDIIREVFSKIPTAEDYQYRITEDGYADTDLQS